MSDEILQQLRDSGVGVDALSPAERDVFASLSPEEAAVLSSIQVRLNSIEDVTGQSMDNNINGIC